MGDLEAQGMTQPNTKADSQSPAEALRQQITSIVWSSTDIGSGMDPYGALDKNEQSSMVEGSVDEIMELVTAYAATVEREAIERIRKWTEYNKHDMGEMGEFIRTQYVYNKLDDELARLAALQGPQDGDAE